MTTKVLRKIVKIDEERCNGCGVCVPACAEGALQIINGKARLVSEMYCDGLGACLGECPQDAITIEEREAEEFNEQAVEHYLHDQKQSEETLPCGCPGSAVQQFECQAIPSVSSTETVRQKSMLRHWPVQLTLVPVNAPFLQGADVILAGDCVPFTYANFHTDFIQDHALLVACPKLDDFQAHQTKLNQIVKESDIRSLTVVRMEVPCCAGLVNMAERAVALSGKNIPVKEVMIGVKGEILN